jgi:uncharacterized protein YuzB (UPF0349 family)
MNKAIMRELGFNDEMDAVELNCCPFCGEKVTEEEFRDDLSAREYTISGLCQTCQDITFGKEN